MPRPACSGPSRLLLLEKPRENSVSPTDASSHESLAVVWLEYQHQSTAGEPATTARCESWGEAMYAYNAEDSRSGDRSHSRGSGEPQNPQKVASVIVPDYSLGAHVAALGLVRR